MDEIQGGTLGDVMPVVLPHKLVNGVMVLLTEEEDAAFKAEWQANAETAALEAEAEQQRQVERATDRAALEKLAAQTIDVDKQLLARCLLRRM